MTPEDDVEAHGLPDNTNEDVEDDVEAHGFTQNTNEDVGSDD